MIAGIMQHIEEAGIHSGDSSCVLPPVDLTEDGEGYDSGLHAEAGAGARCDGDW